MKLRCRKVIVTGGSRGIGFAIAKKLMEEGAQVVISGRNQERLEMAAELLYPYKPIPITLDMRNISSYDSFIKHAAEIMGGLDGLVNNAGICAYKHEWGWKLFDQTEEEWDAVIETNLKGPFFLSRAVAQYMLDNQIHGNILNVISEAAFVPASASYGASKTGLLALTRGLAALLAEKGIVVNAIAPGTTETDMVDIEKEKRGKRQKIGRLGNAEEMAELAVFLMSTSAENIIGQAVLSCGGSTI